MRTFLVSPQTVGRDHFNALLSQSTLIKSVAVKGLVADDLAELKTHGCITHLRFDASDLIGWIGHENGT